MFQFVRRAAAVEAAGCPLHPTGAINRTPLSKCWGESNFRPCTLPLSPTMGMRNRSPSVVRNQYHNYTTAIRLDYVPQGACDFFFLFTGFKYSLPKTILTGILFALTAGLAWLLLYWMPKIRLIITHDRCPLAEADTILVQVLLF